MEKNSKVKAAHAKSETYRMPSEDESKNTKIERALARKPAYTMVTDRLANCSFHVKRQPIPKGKEHFPMEWKLQYVDIFYPQAKLDDGKIAPLYIDQPVSEFEVALCKRKNVVMKKMGLRYTYLEPNRGEPEARQILEQEKAE